MSAPVNFVLLYRGQGEWRITVGTPEELACGALLSTSAVEAFDRAAEEFVVLLRTQWGVEEQIVWHELRPDRWGADLVPGALAIAGETYPSGSD